MTLNLAALAPDWLEDYDGHALWSDLLAGAILAILLVPQAMAYALLAGLSPEAGLYTAMIAPLFYAALGMSAFVSVGPVALASLLVADALGTTDLTPSSAATIIAVETGLMLLALGFLKLGRLVNFVSDPALLGFTAAAAVLIAMSQLPALLGVETPRAGNLIDAARGLLAAGAVHWPTLLIGGAALAVLLLADRYFAAILWRLGVHPPWRLAVVKSVPLAVIVGAALAAASWAPEAAKVAAPSGGLPDVGLGTLDPGAWIAMLPSSAVVAIVVFVTGTAVAKSLSGRRRKALDTSREAIAVGAANVAAGVAGGYAVGVSLSRSALVFDSGARSPLATAFAGMIVLPVILFAGPLLAQLPETALAALVMSAVFGLIKTREIRTVLRHSRAEGGVLILTFLATVALGVQWGLLAGAVAGIAAHLWFSSLPRITRIGPVEGSVYYRSVDRDTVELATLPVLAVRIDQSLYFGNVGHCEDRLQKHLARHPEAKALLLDMRAVNEVDASGIRMLNRLLDGLREQGVLVGFAACHEPVQVMLRSSGPARTSPYFMTIEDGVKSLREACGETEDRAETAPG